MKNLLTYYSFRKDRNPIFKLDETTNSFSSFGKFVAEETRSVYSWISKMKRIERLKK